MPLYAVSVEAGLDTVVAGGVDVGTAVGVEEEEAPPPKISQADKRSVKVRQPVMLISHCKVEIRLCFIEKKAFLIYK